MAPPPHPLLGGLAVQESHSEACFQADSFLKVAPQPAPPLEFDGSTPSLRTEPSLEAGGCGQTRYEPAPLHVFSILQRDALAALPQRHAGALSVPQDFMLLGFFLFFFASRLSFPQGYRRQRTAETLEKYTSAA